MAAFAQPYTNVSPVPRTTEAAALHGFATRREVLERIRIGFRDEAGGKSADAAAEFARAIALDPPEPQMSTAYYDLGNARASLGDYDGAATAYESAIGRDDGFLAARANLVTVRLLAGNVSAARIAADAFVAAAPESARALYASGLVALRANDAATALRAFKALSSADPSYALAHYDIAVAEQELGRFDDAERELRTALDLAPSYARARIALGSVLLREGKKNEARAAFELGANDARDPGLRNLASSLRDAIGH